MACICIVPALFVWRIQQCRLNGYSVRRILNLVPPPPGIVVYLP